MKDLTRGAVASAMSLLMEANGSTTTLEVKMQLRELGFKASQSEVSEIMADIQRENNHDITFTANGTYRTYTFVTDNVDECPDCFDCDDDCEDEIEDTPSVAIKAGGIFDSFFGSDEMSDEEMGMIDEFNNRDSDDDDISASINDFNSGFDTQTSTPTKSSTATVNDVSKPMNLGNYYSMSHAQNSIEAQTDEDTWIVKAKDGIFANTPIYTFDSDLSSDKVRSRYASLTKTKIQDVRARRSYRW